jgi:hypothetical protein
MRRRKLWLVLTLVIGLAIGVGAGYLVRVQLNASNKAKAGQAVKVKTKTVTKSSTPSKTYVTASAADTARITQVVSYLSTNIGPRPAGKAGEKQAGSYLATELEKIGYKVGMDQFPLPNGATSQNLVTADPGQSSAYTFFVCAHMDTVSGSPGANDNATGCAALLEIARAIKGTKHYPEIRFLVFGAEEENSSGTARVGSTYYLGTQPQVERAKIIGVLSMDTIGVGPQITYRDWGPASPTLADILVSYTKAKGLQTARLQGQTSDHEPFGNAGIPAVWSERMTLAGKSDPEVGTSSDTPTHVFVNLVAESVNLTRDYLLSLDQTACKSMAAAKAAAPPPATKSSSGTGN